VGRAMTHEEQRAYQRGYSRGRMRGNTLLQRVLRIAKGYRQRSLLDIDRRCDGCARWERGCETCLWGKCAGAFQGGMEGRMWSEQYIGEQESRAVITSADFACSNWIPK
jgi:hypothetical protein